MRFLIDRCTGRRRGLPTTTYSLLRACAWHGIPVNRRRKWPPSFGRKPTDNPCIVVTGLNTTPRHVYEAVYCARGDAGNRLKELDLGPEIDRTSCTRFLTSPLRVLMRAAAPTGDGPNRRLRSRRTMPLLTGAGTVE